MQFTTLSLIALVAPHFILAAVIPKIRHEAPLLPRAPASIPRRNAAASYEPEIEIETRESAPLPAPEPVPEPLLSTSDTLESILEKRELLNLAVDALESRQSQTEAQIQIPRSEELLEERAYAPQAPPTQQVDTSGVVVGREADAEAVAESAAQAYAEAQEEELRIPFARREAEADADAQVPGAMDWGVGMGNSGIMDVAGFDKREAVAEAEAEAVAIAKAEAEAIVEAEMELERRVEEMSGSTGTAGFTRREVLGLQPLMAGGMSLAR